MKKLSVLLRNIVVICCILCICCGGISVGAFTETAFVCESRAYQDGFLEKCDEVALFSDSGDEAGAKAKLVAAIKNLDASADISGYNIPVGNMNRLINDVVNEHPEFYYFNINQTSYTGLSGKVKNVNFTNSYRFSQTEIRDKNERITAEINRIIEKVDRENMSQAEQALVVHDWFALHYEYDTLAAELAGTVGTAEESVAKAFRIDGLFLDKTAVCQGYALGYMYVLNKLEIPTIFVTSNAMNHGWNMVKIGESWYHVDVTWDDPVPDKLGYAYHTNFLRGDTEFLMETDHYGWTVLEEAPTDYPGMFWENVNSQMIYHGGKWYYKEGAEIACRTFTGTPTTIKEVTDRWPVAGRPGYYYTEAFFTIGLYNGYIYYNTPTQIRKMSTDGTGDAIVLTPEVDGKYLYGVMVDGNLLQYAVAEDIVEEEDITSIELHFTATLEGNQVRIVDRGSVKAGHRFFVAVYSGNNLLSLEMRTVLANQTEYTVTPAKLAEGDKIRVFAWDGMDPSAEYTEIDL